MILIKQFDLIQFEVSKKCNLRCKHCYVSASPTNNEQLSLNDIKKVCEELKPELKIVSITGGEPLVHQEIYQILEYLSKNNIKIELNTNGTLITKNIAKKLLKYKIIKIKISLDGATAKTHDSIRSVPGAFDATIKGIKNCVSVGLPVYITTVIMSLNKDEIVDTYLLSKKLKTKTYHADLICPSGRGVDDKLLIPLDEYYEIFQKLKEYVDVIEERGVYPRCGIGAGYFVVLPSGNVVACPLMRDFVVGNIKSGSMREMCRNSGILKKLKDDNINNIKECNKCKVKNTCRAGCRAKAFYFNNKKLYGVDPVSCAYYLKKF